MTKNKRKGFSKQERSRKLVVQVIAASMATTAIIPAMAVGVPTAEASALKTFNVEFTESELQEGVKTVTVPDLVNVKDIKVNTGNVSFTQDGDQLTITVKDGAPSKRVHNPQKYSKPVSNKLTGSTESFAASNAYSDAEGYSATLAKSGAAKVKSGTLTPAHTKSVTGQTSASYVDGDGYKGTLSQYVHSGSYTPAESKTVTDSRSSSSNSFASSLSYNSGGFSGTLAKSGGVSSYQTGGSYVAGSTQWVTGQTSSWYNSGGYSGHLDSYVYSGSYTPGDMKYVTEVRKGRYFKLNASFMTDWAWNETAGAAPNTVISYNSGGYVGNLHYTQHIFTTGIITDYYPDGNIKGEHRLGDLYFGGYVNSPSTDTRTYRYQGYVNKPAVDTRTYNYTQNYSGTATKPAVDTRTYRYQGDVIKPEVDTRTWEQDYAGTAYKAGEDLFYSYSVDIEYTTDEIPPELTLLEPSTTPTNQDVAITATATDASGIRSIKWAAGDQPAAYFETNGTVVENQTFSVSENGVYTVCAEDNAGNRTTKTVTVSSIDKTPPADATFTASHTHWSHEAVVMTVTFPEDAFKQEVRIDNGDWTTYTGPLTFQANGTLEARSKDEAGNVSAVTSYTVDNYQTEDVGDRLFANLIAELDSIKRYVLSGGATEEFADIKLRLDEILIEAEQLTKDNQKMTIATKVEEIRQLIELLELILSGEGDLSEDINKLPDSPVKDQINAEQAAKDAVDQAEATLDSKDVDTARDAVSKLPEGEVKDDLTGRLDQVEQDIKDRDAYEAAKKAVEQAEAFPTNHNINKAEEILTLVKEGPDKQDLRDRLDKVINDLLFAEAEKQVSQAEKYKRDPYLAKAQETVHNLPAGPEKDAFQARLDAIQSAIDKEATDKLLEAARKKVEQAEQYERDPYLSDAQDLVNKLPVGPDRQDLQDRIDAIHKKLEDAKNEVVDEDANDAIFEDMVNGVLDEEMNKTLRIVHNAIKRAERYGYASGVRHANNRFDALSEDYFTSHPSIMKHLKDRLDAVNQKLAESGETDDQRTPEQVRTEDAVDKAEQYRTTSRIRTAQRYVDGLEDSEYKQELQDRLDFLTTGSADELSKAELKAQDDVDKAEQYGTNSRIRTAQKSVDALTEGDFKADLQDRLDTLVASKQ